MGLPDKSENSRRNRNTWIAALVVGLVIGLAIGVELEILAGVAFTPPRQEILFAINPVQVAGTVSVERTGTIQFINYNETPSTRYDHKAPIVGGNYSIVLSGGYSYSVGIAVPGIIGDVYGYSLYVPSNVTNLTANFLSIAFIESGLASGAKWWVNLNGENQSSTSNAISFEETEGTYAYTVGASNYIAIPASGSITVNGVSANQTIRFVPQSNSARGTAARNPAQLGPGIL